MAGIVIERSLKSLTQQTPQKLGPASAMLTFRCMQEREEPYVVSAFNQQMFHTD